MRSRKLFTLFAMVAPLLLAGCSQVELTTPSDVPGAPPLAPSEGVVALETSRGRAAAELVAQPTRIAPGGQVILRVANRGDLRLGYGRPIMVERWDGREWVETDESRQAAWTLELILVQPREIGMEQAWPFPPGYEPPPGWYRFTKRVQAEDTTASSEQFVVRARVEVVAP